ncbi:MAG: hypothetical protein AAGA96_14825 [Verrucomicrobiota bacterium]
MSLRFHTLAFLFCLLHGPMVAAHAQTISRTLEPSFSMNTPSKVFIEVEPFEVRVEFLVKGPALVQLLDFPLAESQTISIAEQESFSEEASDYFEALFTLTLDGEPVGPESIRTSFLKVGDVTSVLKEELSDEPVDEAVLGLSYIYPVEEVPGVLQFAFHEVPKALKEVPAQVRALEQSEDFLLLEYVPNLNWSSEGLEFALPEIEPVEVAKTNWRGTALLEEKEAVPVIDQLLSNIYNAFEFRDESTIYDQLEKSVVGSQLESIYVEQRRRMEAVNGGGARVKILDVSLLNIDELSTSGDLILMTGQWEVSGKVTHFGHTHDRQNQYQAKLKLTSVEGIWKFSEITIQDAKRIK